MWILKNSQSHLAAWQLCINLVPCTMYSVGNSCFTQSAAVVICYAWGHYWAFAIIIPYINIFYAYTRTHTSTRVCVHLRMGSWKLIEKLPRRSKLGEPKSQKRNHIFCTLTQFSAPQPPFPRRTWPHLRISFCSLTLFGTQNLLYLMRHTTTQWQPWPGIRVSVCVCVGVRI